MQTLVVESAIASLLPDLDHPPFNTCGLSRALGTRTSPAALEQRKPSDPETPET